MLFQVDIYSLLFLLASLQAALLVGVIIRKGTVQLADRYLIATLLLLCITLWQYIGYINGWLAPQNPLFDLAAVAWMGISPMLYLYTHELVLGTNTWRWKVLVYFPFSLYLLVQLPLHTLGVYYGFYRFFINHLPLYNMLWLVVYLANSMIFAVAALRLLNNSNMSLRQQQRLRWLRGYFGVFLVLLTGLLIVRIWLYQSESLFNALEYLLLLLYAAFVFLLVFKSLRYSNFFNELAGQHYALERRSQPELAALHKQLEKKMQEEKLYLDTSLTLSRLAKATDISENQLSQLFNQHLKTNFYHYINGHRLAAFTKKLGNEGLDNFTIVGLAQAAGFNSKSTFYKVFKDAYGCSPSEYLKRKSF